LLDDSANRGGLGVVDNAVKIVLTLDADPTTSGNQALTAAQQAAFLAGLHVPGGSIVEYGSDGAFLTTPVPASAILAALSASVVTVGGSLRRRRKPVAA
jgi:hypothetical protein